MPHVDEGGLHAYLDGALDALPGAEAVRIREHLASCDACARRLEEERALRAEAQAILAGGDPDPGELPDLEELRAMARSAPRGPSAGLRMRRLGFAASLILAVGTGWLLRGGGVPETDPYAGPPAEALPPVGREPESPVAGEGSRGAATAAVPAAPREDEAQPAAVERRSAEAPALVDEPEALLAVTVEAPSPAAADSLATLVREAKAAPAAGRGEPAAPAPTSDAALVVPPRSAPTEAAARRQVSQLLETSAGAPRALTDPATPRGSDDLGPLAVPGLPLISLAWAEDAPAGTLRVLQLAEGDTLEIFHLPPGSDPSDLPGRVPDDRAEVVVARGGGWVVGRARLPRARLTEILSRISGGG